MHSLHEIILLNNRAGKTAAVENNFNRHCSYAGDGSNGLVLHSAKQRSTVHLSKGKQTKIFLAAFLGTNSIETKDALIESYFLTRKKGR